MLDRPSDSVIARSLRQSIVGALSQTRLGAIQWLILCAAGLVLAITLGTAYFAGQFRARALEVAERELNNTALLLSRHFDQQLGDLQHVHDDVVSYMQAGWVDTTDEFEQKMSTFSAHQMLRAKLADVHMINAVGSTPAELAAFLAQEIETYSAIVKAANIKAE